jgi:hypothetical protein
MYSWKPIVDLPTPADGHGRLREQVGLQPCGIEDTVGYQAVGTCRPVVADHRAEV